MTVETAYGSEVTKAIAQLLGFWERPWCRAVITIDVNQPITLEVTEFAKLSNGDLVPFTGKYRLERVENDND